MEVFNNIKKQFDVSQIINKENTNNPNRDLEEVAQEFEYLFIKFKNKSLSISIKSKFFGFFFNILSVSLPSPGPISNISSFS